MAQRLVRVLCDNCRQPGEPTETERRILKMEHGEAAPTVFHAGSCEQCSGTGYRGRTGIYELVLVDDHLRAMIHDGASEQELEHDARTKTPGIRQDGIRKVLEGVTTLEEVVRVTYED